MASSKPPVYLPEYHRSFPTSIFDNYNLLLHSPHHPLNSVWNSSNLPQKFYTILSPPPLKSVQNYMMEAV